MTTLYVFGLDLGQLQDYSALGIVEAVPTSYKIESNDHEPDDIDGPPVNLNLRWLDRFPRGTHYPEVVRGVTDRLRRIGQPSILALDATGVGRAVVDLFGEAGLPSVNVTITGGADVHIDGPEVSVPKRDLVHGLLVALQQGRFHGSNQLPLAEVLLNELANFRLKFTNAGNDTYAAYRESEHDDLVLAVSIACWVAEQEVEARLAQELAQRKIAEFERMSRVEISAY